MVRQTSIMAYSSLKSRDELGKRQIEVLNTIENIGSGTDREIAYFLGKSDPNYVRPRRKELLDFGFIEEQERRLCNVTNKKAIVWSLIQQRGGMSKNGR